MLAKVTHMLKDSLPIALGVILAIAAINRAKAGTLGTQVQSLATTYLS